MIKLFLSPKGRMGRRDFCIGVIGFIVFVAVMQFILSKIGTTLPGFFLSLSKIGATLPGFFLSLIYIVLVLPRRNRTYQISLSNAVERRK